MNMPSLLSFARNNFRKIACVVVACVLLSQALGCTTTGGSESPTKVSKDQ